MENFVSTMVEASDIGWFPLHRAIILDKKSVETANRLDSRMDELIHALGNTPALTDRCGLIISILNSMPLMLTLMCLAPISTTVDTVSATPISAFEAYD